MTTENDNSGPEQHEHRDSVWFEIALVCVLYLGVFIGWGLMQ